ncbi:uncharacterized protein EAE98_001954 [Botrytis deweyae]|uniref:Uncharacterized protein n=1 Tax=Botrytis deweyae TaxID=2478750 RepID=A0ABQ7IZA5_9HELO|nr:uncharacterized protein EAE98_001954 [Botrytis deweyae]KAF7937640.1 hypothetical protein EAE98_001954 [Botrytis deweyae]
MRQVSVGDMQTELGNQPVRRYLPLYSTTNRKCESVLQHQFGYPVRFKSLSCHRHILHQKIYAAESWFVVQDKEDGNFPPLTLCFSLHLKLCTVASYIHFNAGIDFKISTNFQRASERANKRTTNDERTGRLRTYNVAVIVTIANATLNQIQPTVKAPD